MKKGYFLRCTNVLISSLLVFSLWMPTIQSAMASEHEIPTITPIPTLNNIEIIETASPSAIPTILPTSSPSAISDYRESEASNLSLVATPDQPTTTDPVASPTAETTQDDNGEKRGTNIVQSETNTDAKTTIEDGNNEHEQEKETDDDIEEWEDTSRDEDGIKDFTAVVRQSKPYTCGPASLATLLTQKGFETTESQILEILSSTDISEDAGVSLLTLKNASIHLGYQTILKKWTADELIQYVQQSEDPVLIHDKKQYLGGHFSVFRSFYPETNEVELSDTEGGNLKYSVEDFRKIYTGIALVVFENIEEDTIISNTETNLLDTEARDIWGTYVPVSMLASTQNTTAVKNFKICIATAMQKIKYKERNDERTKCYKVLGDTLSVELSNTQELKVQSEYVLKNSFDTSTHKNASGAKELYDALNSIYNAQLIMETKKKELSTLTIEIEAMKTRLSQGKMDMQILESDLLNKKTIIQTLERQIQNGVFEKDGRSMSLGDANKQILAAQTTYTTLSRNLQNTLSTIGGQIRTKEVQKKSIESQISTEGANVQYWQTRISQLQNDLGRAKTVNQKKQVQQKITSAQNNLNGVVSNFNGYKAQLSRIVSDIASLQLQKTNAQNQVNAASAEVAKAQMLADFGKKELERKKLSLSTLITSYNSLGQSRDAKKIRIAQLETDIAKYPNTVNGKKITAAQSEYTKAETSVMPLVYRYGFVTYSSSDTKRLIEEEKNFTEALDTKELSDATKEVKEIEKTSSSLGISLAPIVGEGYDIATLIAGKDPITKEELGNIGTVITVAGLASGIGSGALARKAWKEFQADVLKKTGITEDELLSIAKEVIEEYKMGSFSEFISVWKRISFDNIKASVLKKAEALKASKIPKIVIPKLKSIDIVHIAERHAFGSTPTASKFLEKADIEGLIKTGYASLNKRAVSSISDKFLPDGRRIEFDSIKIEVDLGKTIGVSSKKDTSLLRIIVDLDGNVVSAYPLDKFSITQ